MKKQELIGVLMLLVAWELFARIANNYFFPNLQIIWLESISKVNITNLIQNLGTTVGKTLISFLVGSLFGIITGSVISTNKTLGILSVFTIDFMRSLPSIVVFPLFMILFGINDWTKVLVTAFGIFWIVLFSTIQSIGAIDKTKIKYLKVHGASDWQLFRHYIFFVLFQNWLTTLKITLTLSLFITIVLEMFIGSEYGIGKALTDAKNYYEIPVMYFWIIVAGLVGYGLNKTVSLIENTF
jgi:ABC-type nitrate/sulfonate/bicarbonate transport system permease component